MNRLAAIAATAVLLLASMTAKAEPTFLRCDVKDLTGTRQWDITINEMVSTVSVQKWKPVLGSFFPESVSWKLVGPSIQLIFDLNRLTGEIKYQTIVPSSSTKKHKEWARKRQGNGLCELRQALPSRKF